MSAVDGLRILREDGIVRVRLERAARRNSFTYEMIHALIDELEAIWTDDGVRAIAIEAEGENFCSGVDLGRKDRGREGGDAPPRLTALHHRIDRGPHRLVELIARIEVPVVAAVRGHAAGLGCGLALACDLPIVSDTAKFSAPFVKRGFTPDSATSFLIPRLIGGARAKEMLLTGRVVDAAEAERWGLVARTVPDAEVEDELEKTIASLREAPTTALGLTKWLLWHNADADMDSALGRESLLQDVATRTSDFREGIAAFMEKRRPDFKGT